MNFKFLISNFKCSIIENCKLEIGIIGNSCQRQAGFVAISAVLIIMSVVVAIGTTVTLLSVDEGRSGLALFQGESNLNLVEGCAEDYLLKIRTQGALFVAGNITRPEGTCTITVNSGNPNWNIDVSTTNTAIKRTIRVIFVRNPTGIVLSSWREI